MSGFTKPTVAVHKAVTGLKSKLGQHVPADPRRGYTDRAEFLSPTVAISYEKNHAPSSAVKATILAGANMAKKVTRHANAAMADVVILRRQEQSWFTQTMATHFNLVQGNTAGGLLTGNVVDKKFSLSDIGKRDRRWVFEQIRERMLSLSFHLNTGIYLIDSGELHRDISGGAATAPQAAHTGEEAYVVKPKTQSDPVTGRTTEWKHVIDAQGNKEYKLSKSLTCGFKNGEIHVEFDTMAAYSKLSYAHVLIHEAVHKYLGIDDIYYAHDTNYPNLGLDRRLENADCYAWAAISLYCKAVKMAHPVTSYNPDWQNCT